jgi:hypothetical protein
MGCAALSYAVALVAATLVWKAGSAFLRVGVRHEASSAFAASATWGILLLTSYAGWGSALNTLLFPTRRADWGLRGAWGWGVVAFLGGLLCALHLATRGALVVITGFGVAAFGIEVARGYVAWSRRSVRRWMRAASAGWPFTLGAASVFGVALVLYCATILNGAFNGNDDNVCYFGFAREILDRGTLTQPFSLRRISAYGVKSLFDALQLAIPVPSTHLHVVDGGVALLATLALVAGHARTSRRTSRALVLLLMLLTATLPETRINTATQMTGVVFFLGLYRTLTWAPLSASAPLREAIPVALLAAGACGLRQNYLVPIAVLLALQYGAPILRGVRLWPFELQRAPVVRAATAAAALVVALAPWWAMALHWCGTFLFPLRPGNFSLDYAFFEPLETFEKLHYLWLNVSYSLPVKAVPLLVVAGLVATDRTQRRTLAHFGLAAAAGFFMLIRSYPDSDAPNLGRYYFGFTFAALVAIALGVADASGRKTTGRERVERATGLVLAVVAVALQIYSDREATASTVDKALTAIQPEYDTPKLWMPPDPDPTYAELQAAIPEGAPIVVLVDEPAKLDFKRNQIESLDMVGAISPPPGIPLFGNPDGVADYLVRLGYRYAIVAHPDTAAYLYRRDTWEKNALTGEPVWKRTAHHYLRAFDVFDALRKTRTHLAEKGGMTVLDLSSRL